MINTQVEELSVTKTKAKAEVDALKQAVKQNGTLLREAMYKDLQKVYGHMQHGGKVIDLYESFKKAGLNADGDPKLAICVADAKICHAFKYADGRTIFTNRKIGRWDKATKSNADVVLPKGFLKYLPQDTTKRLDDWNVKHQEIQTTVPIIPVKFLSLIKSKLSNYHILWEVEKWIPEPPKDPILLKQLTPNLYGVLATWELTLLEQAIIRGRIQ